MFYLSDLSSINIYLKSSLFWDIASHNPLKVKRNVPLKIPLTFTGLHGITSEKMELFLTPLWKPQIMQHLFVSRISISRIYVYVGQKLVKLQLKVRLYLLLYLWTVSSGMVLLYVCLVGMKVGFRVLSQITYPKGFTWQDFSGDEGHNQGLQLTKLRSKVCIAVWDKLLRTF
jgi:hypothetical protein